jgi:hypothetical protein
MDIKRVEKKLREAKFFLNKMSKHERLAFNDKEPFAILMRFSAPLEQLITGSAKSKRRCTRVGRTTWDATLTQAQQSLIKFMVDDRNVEVHESGSIQIGRKLCRH